MITIQYTHIYTYIHKHIYIYIYIYIYIRQGIKYRIDSFYDIDTSIIYYYFSRQSISPHTRLYAIP